MICQQVGYYLFFSFVGLNPLHLQPGKLQF